MNEDALLSLIRREIPIHDSLIIVGSGDDCAIIRTGHQESVLKTDATVEGIHFTKEDDLAEVAWKAVCRPLSDFAAMGATPQHALVTTAAPTCWQENEWLQLCRGIGKAAKQFNITIVGGEITRSPSSLFLSVTIVGIPGSRVPLRSAAQPGDLICVTGKLGGSFASKRHLHFTPRLEEGKWLAAQPGVHAMMDLSDGLGSDLPRLARASQCAFILESEKIPCHDGCTQKEAISDGEDYELLLTIAPSSWPKLYAHWEKSFPTVALTPIGTMTSSDQPSTHLEIGFDHLHKSDWPNNRGS